MLVKFQLTSLDTDGSKNVAMEEVVDTILRECCETRPLQRIWNF